MSVLLSPKCKKVLFSQNVSNLELWFYWPLIASRTLAFQRTHYWTLKIQDGWDSPSWKSTWRHFFCRGLSDLDKIAQTGVEWHVDRCDMVKIETKWRIPIWRTFGQIPWHVIPEPRITLHCAATWWIHCHDSRATCHIAGCSHLAKSMSWSCHIAQCHNSIRHIENRFCYIFCFF